MNSSIATYLFMNTIGLTIVTRALVDAHKLLMGTNNMSKIRKRECRESLAYIRGTGLELTLQVYEIPLDAEKLRDNFFTMINYKGYIN